ncbi:transposase [Enterocloster sp. OA13]|uniref:transposase n=1 Tax=Enterocloster sp. OA13 TaxID=2914161 RepID=UPI001F06B8EC|nr:transposase [Enterocloster sp. OA13]
MWRPYIAPARTFFPNAKIIVVKYHFIRQITWAIKCTQTASEAHANFPAWVLQT